jgi:hypothetical protein
MENLNGIPDGVPAGSRTSEHKKVCNEVPPSVERVDVNPFKEKITTFKKNFTPGYNEQFVG